MGISPVIPIVASSLLATLWGLSVFAGWGVAAFCAESGPAGACAGQLAASGLVSGVFAALGVFCTATAWLVRHRQRLFYQVVGAGMAAWTLAIAVLFLGGLLAS